MLLLMCFRLMLDGLCMCGREVERKGAYSIVMSGAYHDDKDDGDEFTYTGMGLGKADQEYRSGESRRTYLLIVFLLWQANKQRRWVRMLAAALQDAECVVHVASGA